MKLIKKIKIQKDRIKIKCIELILKTIDNKYYTYLEENCRAEMHKEIQSQYSQTVSIVDPMQTLNEIRYAISNQKGGAYMRFGDGDAYLASDMDDSFQVASNKLATEMKEAFLLKGDFIYKSLSIHSELYGYEKEMYVGNHLVKAKLADKLLKLTFLYFVGHKIFSPISLHFAATYQPAIANDFLKLLKDKCVLFIGNESVPEDTVKLLFGQAQHVKTPSANAYDVIDAIENEAVSVLTNINDFGIVVLAMGCGGRPMMKRLYNRGYNVFLFDFGSLLDGICGDNSRTWLKKENIDYATLLKNL